MTQKTESNFELRVGGRECRCAACGETFGGADGFDRHRVGDHPNRRCRTPDEMRERGMRIGSRGFWITKWRGPRAEPAAAV